MRKRGFELSETMKKTCGEISAVSTIDSAIPPESWPNPVAPDPFTTLWNKIEKAIITLTPNSQLDFQVHVVDHCNLNCKQCSHFSPLAEEHYIDVHGYERDCNRLSELFGGEMSRIDLMGGEPLLHPQINQIIKITRTAFPIGTINIVTNGILLASMPQEFWRTCKEYNAIIWTSYYPLNIDYEECRRIAEKEEVEILLPLKDKRETNKSWVKCYPIRSENFTINSTLVKSNFLKCAPANACIALKEGKLYPCNIAPHAIHLKKYFNLDIKLSKNDGVDIYSVKSGEELLKKLAKPIPFCKYCDVTRRCYECNWGLTRRDRYEWLTFEFSKDDIEYLKTQKPTIYVFGAGAWGKRTIKLLKSANIHVKAVLATRTHGIDNILGVPIMTLDNIGELETDSICLVALATSVTKEEIYPFLSKIGFRDVIPISGSKMHD